MSNTGDKADATRPMMDDDDLRDARLRSTLRRGTRSDAMNREPVPVLQEWVQRLTFMQQSVLICAVRGPDGIRKDHPVKVLCRFFRRCVLYRAFDGKATLDPYAPGGGSFTGPLPNGQGTIDQYIDTYLRHVDELPHHFQLHLMHAAEIVGYKCPDDYARRFWHDFYLKVVNDAHLQPESEAAMDKRLGDCEKSWREAEVVTAK